MAPVVRWSLGAIVALVLIAAAWSTWSSASRTPPAVRKVAARKELPPLPTPTYVGDAACTECHPGEAVLHSRSGHSRTLHLLAGSNLAKKLDGREVPDPESPAVTFRYENTPEGLAINRIEGDRSIRGLAEYAVGSGVHGITFFTLIGTLNRKEPDLPSVGLEHRLSYRPEQDTFLITPGQDHDATFGKGSTRLDLGRGLSAERTRVCLDCHVTRTSDSEDLLAPVDPKTMILNVGCERCHGPGSNHIELARGGDDRIGLEFGSRNNTSARDEIRRCGACHRLPEQLDSRSVHPDNIQIVRLQSVGLTKSRCYTITERIRCSDCHDSHDKVEHEPSRYEFTCLGCHSPATRPGASPPVVCPQSPLTGCIDCHMPRRELEPGISFTDHWIRVVGRPQIGVSPNASFTPPGSVMDEPAPPPH